MDETKCLFVSSRGILKSCDIHNAEPRSSSDYLDPEVYSKVQTGHIVYLCTESIPHFINTYLAKMAKETRIVIVSGDSDLTFPKDILPEWEEVIRDPRIIHWYAQNCIVGDHPKLTQIPIGLDYHTLSLKDFKAPEHMGHPWGPRKTPKEQEEELFRYASIEPNREKREQRAYGNFLQNITRGDRREAFAELPKEHVLYERGHVSRANTWWKQGSCAFTISPHGNGMDCHRTWETLALGGIPVVKTSRLDTLYEGLPVLILNNWGDFTDTVKKGALERFQRGNFEKLLLEYWMAKIKRHIK